MLLLVPMLNLSSTLAGVLWSIWNRRRKPRAEPPFDAALGIAIRIALPGLITNLLLSWENYHFLNTPGAFETYSGGQNDSVTEAHLRQTLLYCGFAWTAVTGLVGALGSAIFSGGDPTKYIKLASAVAAALVAAIVFVLAFFAEELAFSHHSLGPNFWHWIIFPVGLGSSVGFLSFVLLRRVG